MQGHSVHGEHLRMIGDLDDVGRSSRGLTQLHLAEPRPADAALSSLSRRRPTVRRVLRQRLQHARSPDHLDQQDMPVPRPAEPAQPVVHQHRRGLGKRGRQLAADCLVDLPQLGGLQHRVHRFQEPPLGRDQPVDVGHDCVSRFGCPVRITKRRAAIGRLPTVDSLVDLPRKLVEEPFIFRREKDTPPFHGREHVVCAPPPAPP